MGSLKLQNEAILKVSLGNSRFEKQWKNVQTPWSELVERITQPLYTAETFAQYKQMTKKQQTEIKDVGGFVGGIVHNGQRLASNVKQRQLLTLDLDYPPSNIDLRTDTELLLGCACAWYSTHSHSKDSPRLRLVIPLNRPVSTDEYEAVARKITARLGIDYFDDTTYQPHRLMYWPSVARDGEFTSGYHDKQLLSPDKILAEYEDWRDITQWPVSSRQAEVHHKSAEKQGNPREKKGIVGLFCKTYNVEDIIRLYLSNIYIDCGNGRYTFTGGSTSAGVIVYQNGDFLYSHHATDPISGQLVNAFDLMRIHLFKDLDANTDPTTPINNHPSYKKMVEAAQADERIKAVIAHERIINAEAVFDDVEYTPDPVEVPETPNDISWASKLDIKKSGEPTASAGNALLIMNHDPNIARSFVLDAFCGRIRVTRDLPWRKLNVDQYWTDADDAGLRNYFGTRYKIAGVGVIKDAWMEIAHRQMVHPVKDYLNSLQWDGISRCESLLIDYLGADDTEYTRAVTKKSLVAAVARIYKPGYKFDNVLTMVGPQGVGKSYILKLIGRKWHSDSLVAMKGKEAFESLQGFWIMELAELSATRKADVETVKHFISKQEDSYRVAYGHHTAIFPRQCVFFGTTNDYKFLTDRTGNRRFWPVVVGKNPKTKDIFTDLTEYEIDQLWAEARYRFLELHEPTHLDTDLERQATNVRDAHEEEDPMVGIISKFLDMPVPKALLDGGDVLDIGPDEPMVVRDSTCIAELWVECLGNDRGNLNTNRSRAISNVMKDLPGWQQTCVKRFAKYGPQRAYERVK